MKKQLWFLSIICCCFLFLPNCGNLINLDTNTEKNENLQVISDQSQLSGYLSSVSQNIVIDDISEQYTTTSITAQAKKTNFNLTKVATISSPVVEGEVVQATSVFIENQKALISYNMQGEKWLGAIDIVDIKNTSKPNLIARIIFKDSDVHHASIYNNYILLALAANNSVAPNYAKIMAIEFKSDTVNLDKKYEKNLSSYAATCIQGYNNNAFVTTGSNGKLYALTLPELEEIASVNIADARWLTEKNNYLYVLQGTDGTMNGYKLSNNAFTKEFSYSFAGAATLEAKSTVECYGLLTFIAANETGVQIHDRSTHNLLTTIPLPTTSLAKDKVLSNAVSVDKNLIFVSNGEAGVYVAERKTTWDNLKKGSALSIEIIGKLNLGENISVNHINYKNNVLFVAAGLGGMQIIFVDNTYDEAEGSI